MRPAIEVLVCIQFSCELRNLILKPKLFIENVTAVVRNTAINMLFSTVLSKTRSSASGSSVLYTSTSPHVLYVTQKFDFYF